MGSSRCSRENHPDCRLSTSRFKTSGAAVKHSRLKWAKSASVKDAPTDPQEVRAHCDSVTTQHQRQARPEMEDFWPPLKSLISRGQSLSVFLVPALFGRGKLPRFQRLETWPQYWP